MFAKLNLSWQKHLQDELEKDYFNNLMQEVENAYSSAICFPPKQFIFKALNSCSFEDVKVVIIGQDPYHGEGEANGLAFSVNDGVRIPPSLRNIFKEINSDLDRIIAPNSGNLEHWASQGVLLLNATLTVQKDLANSHKHLQWQQFTNAIIRLISDKKEQVVFLLWGNFAQKKASLIDENKHLILTSGHPSPMSANQGKWFGNKHFSKTNTYLVSHDLQPINW
jgi:uracil-DNA glycosylase